MQRLANQVAALALLATDRMANSGPCAAYFESRKRSGAFDSVWPHHGPVVGMRCARRHGPKPLKRRGPCEAEGVVAIISAPLPPPPLCHGAPAMRQEHFPKPRLPFS